MGGSVAGSGYGGLLVACTGKRVILLPLLMSLQKVSYTQPAST